VNSGKNNSSYSTSGTRGVTIVTKSRGVNSGKNNSNTTSATSGVGTVILVCSNSNTTSATSGVGTVILS
jgi:hypothetical protein